MLRTLCQFFPVFPGRYVDRVADRLKKLLSDSEKMMSLSRLMITRRKEALDEETATEPKVDLLRKRTQQLKGEVSVTVDSIYAFKSLLKVIY